MSTRYVWRRAIVSDKLIYGPELVNGSFPPFTDIIQGDNIHALCFNSDERSFFYSDTILTENGKLRLKNPVAVYGTNVRTNYSGDKNVYIMFRTPGDKALRISQVWSGQFSLIWDSARAKDNGRQHEMENASSFCAMSVEHKEHSVSNVSGPSQAPFLQVFFLHFSPLQHPLW